MVLDKRNLQKLYLREKLSSKDIARSFCCSENKINYWIAKYKIPKRSISDALYIKNNPKGDPFTKERINVNYKSFLYGLGLGLYWGEGNKSNRSSVRLGNTDPHLIKKFIEFLQTIYNIEKSRLKFGLQVFSDMHPEEALRFWCGCLNLSRTQFYKVTVTQSRHSGTYTKKISHGVLTVYFNNTKLRNEICGAIEKLRIV